MNILYGETKTDSVSWLISDMIAYIYYSNKNYDKDDTEHRFSDLEFEKIMSMLRYSIGSIPRRDCEILRSVLHTPLEEWEKYITGQNSYKHARVIVKENIDWHLKEGL